MKRITLLLAGAVLLVSFLSVSADLIWTPEDDYFGKFHLFKKKPECHRQDRYAFLAAGENGYVESAASPRKKQKITDIFPNGSVLYIPWICEEDGEMWGVVEYSRKPEEGSLSFVEGGGGCYVRMSDLVQAYDDAAFREDHEGEISPFEGEFDLCSSDGVMIWLTPGSGIPVDHVPGEKTSRLCDPESAFYSWFEDSFVDRNGDRWVEISMLWWKQYGWVCLDRLNDLPYGFEE